MTPQYQTIQGGATGIGDCFRCCLASIMDLPATDVPHFHAGARPGQLLDGDVRYLINLWLNQRGFGYVENAYKMTWADLMLMMRDMAPHISHVLTGRNGSGFTHAVVGKNGAIIHDPATRVPRAGAMLHPCADGYYRVGMIVGLR